MTASMSFSFGVQRHLRIRLFPTVVSILCVMDNTGHSIAYGTQYNIMVWNHSVMEWG